MKSSEKTYYIFLRMINHFNITFSNKSDFSIIVELINRSEINRPISISELADICHVSQSTISRFVRKLGFVDYQDFNYNFYRSVELAQLKRKSDHENFSNVDVLEKAKMEAIQNLETTYNSLDIGLLNTVIETIKRSKNTIFLGTPENIAHFARFQKDLISNSIPAFIFYDPEAQLEFLKLVNRSTCAIFFILNNSYLRVHRKKIEELKNKQAKLILFTQEFYEDSDHEFDLIYQFGHSNSFRYGEYSLEYLADVLSSLLYKDS
ncbi:hypothetical protein ACYSNW_13165 [Enterococcus sp. LJL99]